VTGHRSGPPVDADERDRYVEAHRDLIVRARKALGCLDVAITADPVDHRRDSWDAVEAWRPQAHAPDIASPSTTSR